MSIQALSIESADTTGNWPNQKSLQFRNYDHKQIVEVTVTVDNQSGETAHKETYMLTPQTTWSTSLSIESGTYCVSATVGSNTSTAETCQINSNTNVGATIEVGNGAVSVQPGR
jgi:hypothetical protein